MAILRGQQVETRLSGSYIISGSTQELIASDSITLTGNVTASGTIKADAFESVAAGATIDFNDDINVVGDVSASLTGSFGVLTLANYNQGYGNQNNTYFGLNTGAGGTNQKNVGIGYQALSQESDSGKNVAIGYQAMYEVASADQNVAIGESAGYQTNQDNTVYIGWSAGKEANSFSSVIIGTQAGNVHSGQHSVIIGTSAGRYNTSANHNVFIGSETGQDITTGDGNVFIGYKASGSLADSQNRIAIGSGSLNTLNNSTVIGNESQVQVLFGGDSLVSGSSKSTGSFGTIRSPGPVEIGAVVNGAYDSYADDLIIKSPDNTHAGITIHSGDDSQGVIYFADGHSGNAKYRGYLEYNHDSDRMKLATGATARVTILSSGNVGIGVTNPTATLHVDGDAIVTGILTAQEFHTEFTSASIQYTSGSTKFGDTSDDIHSLSGSLRITGSGDHYITDGDVGIGIISPDQTLHVHKGSAGSVASDSNTVLTVENSDHSLIQILSPEAKDGAVMFGNPTDGALDGRMVYDNADRAIQFWTAGTQRVTIDSSGNVTALTGNISASKSGSFVDLINSGDMFSTHLTGSFSGSFVGQIGARFVHVQSVASTTWTISHALGTKYPNVTVYNSSDQMVIPTSVTANDSNNMTLTFSSAVAGKAMLGLGGGSDNVTGRTFIESVGTAAAIWRVTHSLGEQYPAVTVYDETDRVIIPDGIRAVDASLMEITFEDATSGNAHFSVGNGLPGINAGNAGKFMKVNGAGTHITYETPAFDATGSLKVTGSIEIVGSGSVSGSSVGTGSFGHLIVAGNVSASGIIRADSFESVTAGDSVNFADSVNVVGSITASAGISVDTDMSGSATSTGSFGHGFIGDKLTFSPTQNTEKILLGETDIGIANKDGADMVLFADTNGEILFADGGRNGNVKMAIDFAAGGVSIGNNVHSKTPPTSGLMVEGNISGSSTSTGSFGFVKTAGAGNVALFGDSALADEYIAVRSTSNGAMFGIDASLNSGNGGVLISGGANKSFAIKVAESSTFGANTPEFTIDTSGNVDITSGYLKVAAGATGEYFRVGGDDNNNDRALRFSSSTTSFTGDTHTINAPSAGGNIVFQTNSTERLRIDNAGNISGSATSTGSFGQLHLGGGNSAENPTLNFGDGNTGIRESEDNQMRFVANGSDVFRLDAGGLFGGSAGHPYMIKEVASSTNPVFTFTSDTNTGIGQAGADTGSLVAGGTNVLNWRGDGHVGVGTTTPEGALQVLQSSTSVPVLILSDTGIIDYKYSFPDTNTLKLEVAGAADRTFQLNNTSGNFNFSLDGGITVGTHITGSGNATFTGNVGIGTTSPASPLHIINSSDGGTTEMILDNSAAGDSTDEFVGFRFRHNGGTAAKILVGREENFGSSANRSGFISFKTSKDDSESEKMKIHAAGTVEFPVANQIISGSSTSTGSFGRHFAGDAFYGANSTKAPAYTFHSDTDTGMFSSEANSLGFTTAGTSALSFNSSQTATFTGDIYVPNDIVHSGDTDTLLNFSGDVVTISAGGNSTKFTTTQISGSSTSTGSFGEGFFAGNVSIAGANSDRNPTNLSYSSQAPLTLYNDVGDGGTTPPMLKLVDTDADTTANTKMVILFSKAQSAGSFVDAGSIETGITSWGGSSGNRHTYMTFNTVADGTNAERVRITDVGKVGIDVPSPGQTLSVQGDTYDNIGIIAGTDVFGLITCQGSDLAIKASNSNDIVLHTNATERVNINHSGNVLFTGANQKISGSSTSTGSFGHGFFDSRLGIGTLSPGDSTRQFEISSTGTGAGIRLTKTGGSNNPTYDLYVHESSDTFIIGRAAVADDVIFKDGSLGISTTPTEKLHVAGNIFATGNISGSSTSTGSFGRLGVGIAQPTADKVAHFHGFADGFGYIQISDANIGGSSTDGLRIGYNSGVARIQNFENSDMQLMVNTSTEALRLESDGSVTMPTANATLSGSFTSTGSFGRVNTITGFFEGGSKISDYVFEDDYNLRTLDEVETHISQSKHLPGIPSEANIQEWRDLSMGDKDRLLLEKIEELTLYTLQLNKRIEELERNSE